MSRYRPPAGRESSLVTLALLIAAVAFVYPFLWMLFSGFKDNREIFRSMQMLPGTFDFTYYLELLGEKWFPFSRVFVNSLVVASSQALGAVALTSLAGYAFAWHSFRGRRVFFLLSITVVVVPQQAFAVPLFTWIHALHLGNHLAGVILPGMVSGLGILYFTQVFRQVPGEFVESSRLAGASEFRVYLTLLPLTSSALLSFGLIHFILAWHEHLVPLLVLSSAERQTLPLALSALYGSSLRFPYAVLMAASTLTILPTAIVFGLLHRRFKSSLADLLVH